MAAIFEFKCCGLEHIIQKICMLQGVIQEG